MVNNKLVNMMTCYHSIGVVVSNHWTGLWTGSLDYWTAGLDYWTDL